MTVLIVGAGLIGASIGLALRQAGVNVVINDAERSHALVAAGLGAGNVADPEPEGVDLVVVAVPPRAIAPVVAEALRRFPQAVVTDVGSVKAPILDALADLAADCGRYIGSHPMAGSHRSGPLTARGDLFHDRPWVITPHPEAEPRCQEVVEKLATHCGAIVEIMTPIEHDVAVAKVSHLPQIMASLTAGRLVEASPSQLRLAGQGLRDVVRIAASDPDLWEQIIAANETAVRAELAAIQDDLVSLVGQLNEPEVVHDFIDYGRIGARRLPGKHGHDIGATEQVVVEIPDSPGALAELFAGVAEAGVNVEDLEIEHAAEREVGYLSITVARERTGALTRALTESGWTVRG